MSLVLLHSPADVLRWMLIALGAGSDPTDVNSQGLPNGAWPIYVDSEPSLPDNCVTLYDTAPSSDGRIMIDGENVQHPGFQVRIRGTDHPTAFVRAEYLEHVLAETLKYDTVHITTGTVTSTYLVCCAARLRTTRMGKDVPNTKRSLYTINGILALRRQS